MLCSGWTATRWETRWTRPTRLTSTRGKKGVPHPDPAGPPRRRANRRRGHGAFANDRPPVAGVVGRQSSEVRLDVIESAGGAELEGVVDDTCLEGTTVNTDEWKGYGRVGTRHRRGPRPGRRLGPERQAAQGVAGDGERG